MGAYYPGLFATLIEKAGGKLDKFLAAPGGGGGGVCGGGRWLGFWVVGCCR